MKLAHLSDPHLPVRGLPPLNRFLNKRALGYLNWLRRRRMVHRRGIVDALVADLKAHAPDHVALTGDLINVSLHREFRDAAAWLAELGAADLVSLVPGNHDAYVPVSHRRGLGLWHAYMRGDDGADAAPAEPFAWPYLRRRGQVAFVCLSTAVPTGLPLATGELGSGQIDRADALLRQLKAEGLCRVVLIHHPPLAGQTLPHRRLTDSAAFEALMTRAGAELVLHGHNHTDTLAFTPGAGAPVPVVGVPSASSTGGLIEPAAQYNLFTMEKRAKGWRIAMEARRIDPDTMEVATVYRRKLWETAAAGAA